MAGLNDYLKLYVDPAVTDAYDYVTARILSHTLLSDYYDVSGVSMTPTMKNYIPVIEAGETRTVHCACLITENMQDDLYLDLTSKFRGPGTETGRNLFWGAAKDVGLVELR